MFDLDNPLLAKCAQDEGFDDTMAMLEHATYDSVVPAICTKCESTMDMEPDQDRGWCDECGTNTVKSCLVLAGII